MIANSSFIREGKVSNKLLAYRGLVVSPGTEQAPTEASAKLSNLEVSVPQFI